MLNLSTKQRFFVRSLALAVLCAVALAASARAEDGIPPPPPEFTPDSVVPGATEGLPAEPSAPAGAAAPAEPAAPVMDENSPAAPQISDDQMIKNYMEIALQLYHAEDWEGVIRQCKQILDRYPKRQLYWVRYLLALAQEHSKLYVDAVDSYKKVREQAPRSTYGNSALFRQGLSELHAGLDQEAIYTLREVIETHPRSEYRLQAHVHLGNLYRRQREWKAAITIYRDLAKAYPNSSWAYTSLMTLGECYAQQGRNSTAIQVYEGVRRNPKTPLTFRAQAQLRIGDLYLGQKDWLEAIQAYRQAIRDFNGIPGITPLAEEKIIMATEGRRSDRLPYRTVRGGPSIKDAPADEKYRLSQESEALPYE